MLPPQPTYLCVSQPAAAVCPLAYEGSQPDELLPPDPETFWQSRQHVWCHSSLAGRSLPCTHHQWFPPDGKGHVSLSGRHQAFLSKGDQNKIYLSCPPLAKLRCSLCAMAGLGFHGFWQAGLAYLIFTREQSKKDFSNFQIPCLQVCTHLVNIVRLNPAVKADVQIVEHLNNLQGSTGGSNACEPHNVREKDGHLSQGEGKCEAKVSRQQWQSLWRVWGFVKFWAEQPKAQAEYRTSVAELNRYNLTLASFGSELFSITLTAKIMLISEVYHLHFSEYFVLDGRLKVKCFESCEQWSTDFLQKQGLIFSFKVILNCGRDQNEVSEQTAK